MRARMLLALGFLALGPLSACQRAAEASVELHPPAPSTSGTSGGVVVPTSASSSSSGASNPVCTSSEDRCVSDEVARVCDNGAAWTEKRCDKGAVCLSGACVSLQTPTGGALDPSALLAPRGAGWLNAWAAFGPIAGPIADVESQDAGPAPPVRALCAPGGYVTVHEKPEPRKSGSKTGLAGLGYQRLLAYVVAGRADNFLLAAGVAGKVRVSVGDKRVLEITRESDPAPFRDESRIPIALPAGLTRLVVEIEQVEPSEPTGFWLRILSKDGRGPAALLFAPDPVAACNVNDLLQVDVSKRPIAGGFGVDVRPAWMGLGPRLLLDLPYSAELGSNTKKGDPRPLGDGVVKSDALGAKDGAFSFTVPLEKTGTFDVRLKLGVTPFWTNKVPLVYRPGLHKRVVALADKRDFVESSSAVRGDKDSLLWHIDELLKNVADGDPDISWISKQTEAAEEILMALGKHQDPYASRSGIVRRAYRSPLDGHFSPYVLYVPGAYKPGGKPLPLVVAAHGLGNRPEIALRVVVGEAPESGFNGTLEARHIPGLPDLGTFIVAPNQFGNSGQRHLGEDDALRVIDEVRAHYPIDERRISVTGYSLGGTVSFFLPLHYPDLFSASAPLCGYPNLLGWDTIRKPPHTPWEDIIVQKRYILNWAANGQYIPLFMVHGGKDDPSRSQIMADRYRSLGYTHKLDVQEDLDHNVWDYGYKDGDMIALLRSHKRPKAPDRVRFVTGEWRYDRSHWVRFGGFESETTFAEIDARNDKKNNTIVVKTRNVESFALDLSQLSLKKEPKLVIDEKTLETAATEPALSLGMSWFVKTNGSFSRVAAEPSRLGRKRAFVSGPLDDIDRHKKLIVYGTQDPNETEANRMVAEHFASFDTFAAHFPIKSDVEVSDAEIQTSSLVLIGNPKSNRVVASFAAELPVHFEDNQDALTFRGKRYEGHDVGLSFIQPHPKNPAEYIVVHAGVHAEGTLASRHIPRFAPDFLVYNGHLTQERGGHLLDRREVLEGGFFDINWR